MAAMQDVETAVGEGQALAGGLEAIAIGASLGCRHDFGSKLTHNGIENDDFTSQGRAAAGPFVKNRG